MAICYIRDLGKLLSLSLFFSSSIRLLMNYGCVPGRGASTAHDVGQRLGSYGAATRARVTRRERDKDSFDIGIESAGMLRFDRWLFLTSCDCL